jgi:phospholipid/cholesterol/gamma-HCH transport system substrate-binding protein
MMRSGAEIKVGIITVVAIALLAGYFLYVRGYRVAVSTYNICVVFGDARGLQHGDPVRMVGVKIGEVSLVEIKDLKAQVTLKIRREYDLFDDYKFQIATSGLIEERFIDVVPAPPNPYAAKLKENTCVQGVLQPSLSDLVVAGAKVLDNLNHMAKGINVLLSDQQILTRVQGALQSFSAAADAATNLAETTSALAEQSQPQVLATLEQMKNAAADMRAVTLRLRSDVERGAVIGDLEETMKHARATAANAERASASVADLVSDPQTRQQIKESIAAIHDAAVSAKQIGDDLQTFSGELRKAAPVVPKATHAAEEYVAAAQTIRERLRPPQINASFDMLYGAQANRWFSSGRVDIGTQPDRFLRIGMDDIGEQSNATVQVGERHGKRVLRYGLYRSRLGAGMDLALSRRTTLSLDLFDPNDLRLDLLADVPVIPGRSDLSLILGARDIGHDSTVVGGVRVKR